MTLSICAAIAALLFASTILLVSTGREGRAADLIGIAYHALLLPIIQLLAAPEFGRAAGFGWAILDVVAGVLPLNGVERSLARNIRIAAHVPAGIWFVAAGVANGGVIGWIGVPLGVATAGHALFAAKLGMKPMYALGPLVIVWLITIAVINA